MEVFAQTPSAIKCTAGTFYINSLLYISTSHLHGPASSSAESAQTDGEGMNSGHKQVKLHGLLLNLINLIDSLEEATERLGCPRTISLI